MKKIKALKTGNKIFKIENFEEIEAYETNDGDIYLTEEEALEHEEFRTIESEYYRFPSHGIYFENLNGETETVEVDTILDWMENNIKLAERMISFVKNKIEDN